MVDISKLRIGFEYVFESFDGRKMIGRLVYSAVDYLGGVKFLTDNGVLVEANARRGIVMTDRSVMALAVESLVTHFQSTTKG